MPFGALRSQDVEVAGGKLSSLGELMTAGQNVPDGFAVTTHAYRHFIDTTGLQEPIAAQLDGLNISDTVQLAERAQAIRGLILEAIMPEGLVTAIQDEYARLGEGHVSVRSSSSVEDGSEASFAGQQDTFLYIRGAEEVVKTVQRCFASLWTDRAIEYAHTRGFNHLDISMAVGVQRMVNSDEGVSGVMFTIDPNSGHPGFLNIEATYGLGEGIVAGIATPDGWLVSRFALGNNGTAIVERTLGSKEAQLVRVEEGTGTRQEPVPEDWQTQYCMTDEQVRIVAHCGLAIHEHYGMPMDVEWCIDGDGELWILQARPETVASNSTELRRYELDSQPDASTVIAEGTAVGNMIASGVMYVLDEPDPAAMATFPEGGILVTEETTPSWMPALRKAAAIITKRGGRTSHAAIVAREQAVPAVCGVGDDFDRLISGHVVTVSCADGAGIVYVGEHPFTITVIDPSSLPDTETDVMFNLADPKLALERSQLPHKGVGLLRAELIIAEVIKVHPMALLEYPNVENPTAFAQIQQLTAGYAGAEFFVRKLSAGIGMIAAAFAPHPVIFRLSDFKTNEYRELVGGIQFEGSEENPMLGFRGAGRYTDPRYQAAFALECDAISIVRDVMGLTNLKVMVPFIRTPQEGRRVLEVMERHGIPQGQNGLEVYAMIEVPSNALLAAEFAEIFDGFSIGSNDLTQLVLGVDRDSGDESLVATFDEMDPAVLMAMDMAITAAREAGIPCGICGQGPSDRPELAAWLVERGISSVSVLPDALEATLGSIAQIEGERAPESALA